MVEVIWSHNDKSRRAQEILAEEFVQQLVDKLQATLVYTKHCSEWSEVQYAWFIHNINQRCIKCYLENAEHYTLVEVKLSYFDLGRGVIKDPTATSVLCDWLRAIQEEVTVDADDLTAKSLMQPT